MDDAGEEPPLTLRDPRDVWRSVRISRDMRVAHAAGDMATYNRLLYGGDGRSPAETEAEAEEWWARLPTRAAWQEREARARAEKLERSVEEMEEAERERVESEMERDMRAEVGGGDESP